MKIAFIINSLGGGGAERVLQTLCNYLVNHGHEIIVILLESEKKQYEMDEKVKIITLKSSFLAKGMGKIAFIPIQSYELNKLLHKLDVEHAISFLVRANLVFCLTKIFSNRKVIISERTHTKKEYEKNNFKNKVMNFLIKNLYKKADKIVSISNGIKHSLINDYKLDPSKITTIHNPQDIEKIQMLNEDKINFDFKEEFQYFITLGRLAEEKDHITLIKAFKLCHTKFPHTKLLILGQGYLKEKLKDLIKKLELEDAVFLLGFVKNPFDYLKKSDIFVFSSKFEGFGNVLVEAMACGLPVISTDCPSGPAEILENGKYGLLAKVANIEELGTAMIDMLDKKTYSHFQQQSLNRVKDFDVSIIAKQYLQVLDI